MIREILSLIFPPLCIHCGRPLVGNERHLCTFCLSEIPWSRHAQQPDNLAEMRLVGRIPTQSAASLMIFQKGNVAQSIVHQIKYHGSTQLAKLFGHLLGDELIASGRFDDIDYLVPVPLHWRRQLKRGYNQSQLLCEAIAEKMNKPIVRNNLYRKKYTTSQTHKNRLNRLENMQGVFAVRRPQQFENKHILLVDDILTTGATTEACYSALATIPDLTISVAVLAVTSN
jgi:ComF family protein